MEILQEYSPTIEKFSIDEAFVDMTGTTALWGPPEEAAEKIRKDSEVLVVIGIGGSYLGAKAVIEAMKPYFKNEKDVEIIFAGHTLSSTYASQLLKYLENKEFSINVISKSGTTTEPAVAFRLFKELLIKKYGSYNYN